MEELVRTEREPKKTKIKDDRTEEKTFFVLFNTKTQSGDNLCYFFCFYFYLFTTKGAKKRKKRTK